MSDMASQTGRGTWSSRMTFIFAAVGSAVGLGNIWKFPYEAGQSGGGAFIMIYLGFVLLIGTPIMIAELVVGRRGKLSPPSAILAVGRTDGAPLAPFWTIIGWFGLLGAFLVLSFYSVIAGWTLSYFVATLTGSIDASSAEGSSASFAELLNDNQEMIFWHFLFMLLTILITVRGIKGGLEKAVAWMMPLLFVLLVILSIYSLTVGNSIAALNFLFTPDFSKVNNSVIIEALGQAFFSLSLGLGTMMAYGSYLSRDISIHKSALIVAGADTGVAILAGMAIFPLVFQYNLEAAGGPGLIFVTLPLAFEQMPGGIIFGGLFFLLLTIAALTSAISLIEPIVARLQETGMTRFRATLLSGISVFVVGIASALSFNRWSDLKFAGRTWFENIDFLTNNIIMPLGGLLLVLFVAWALPRSAARDEMVSASDGFYAVWRFMARYLCPIAMLLVFLQLTVGLF